MSFLEVIGVCKTFWNQKGPLEVLRDVSFEVERGEFVAIIGPSGCGKSTLLSLIAGFEKPESGRILLEGRPVNRWGRDRVLIFQEPLLFPWLTVRENVEFGLKVLGVSKEERRRRVKELIEKVRLEGFEDRYPHELSGGMKQRVALARALAVDPLLLLMDEPFASVDALTRSHLQQELVRIWREYQNTIIFVTHSLKEALLLADRILILTKRPAQIKMVFKVNVPRPREDKLHELALLELELLKQLES
jgi:ABC-type nitrate/sulfonate/bicarbonate transport system ATPase subunit